MPIDFENDPKNGRDDLPYYLYALVFVVGLAIVMGIGW
jgi:hypothetical protein